MYTRVLSYIRVEFKKVINLFFDVSTGEKLDIMLEDYEIKVFIRNEEKY